MSYRGYGIQGVFALEKLGERDMGFLLQTSQFSTYDRGTCTDFLPETRETRRDCVF